jgi:hypothetical protein
MTATDPRQAKHTNSVFCNRHEDRKADWEIVIHRRSKDAFLIITLQAVTLTPKVGTYVNPASANTGESSENAAHEVRDQGFDNITAT